MLPLLKGQFPVMILGLPEMLDARPGSYGRVPQAVPVDSFYLDLGNLRDTYSQGFDFAFLMARRWEIHFGCREMVHDQDH